MNLFIGLTLFFSPVTYQAPPIDLHVPTIEEKIEQTAIKFSYSSARAIAIAKAESGLKPEARNSHSTASGLYQFIDGTFKAYCINKFQYAESLKQKNDPDIQIQCAVRMLSEGGESHWNASKPVWIKVKTQLES